MDGITEPVILVLGHPIAGNPSQFVLEREIRALNLPWRVLSCDVQASQVDEAIAGAAVLGFRGLLLDQNLVRSRADTPSGEPNHTTNFYFRAHRDDEDWQTHDLLGTWLEQSIRSHFESIEKDIGDVLCIGSVDGNVPFELAASKIQTPIAWASEDEVEKANWIVVTESVDVTDWPRCRDGKLVIDLANPACDADSLREKGYTVLGHQDSSLGILMICLEQMTGKVPNQETLMDSIEEYLAV